MFGNVLNCTQSPGGKRLGLVYVSDNVNREPLYDAIFGLDLWSVLADNLDLDTDPGHATFGKWILRTDGPAYSDIIYDSYPSIGKPCFFIPIFELSSADKHFSPSQWAGDYTDYTCVVKSVTFGIYNYGDSTIVPISLQCLVVYAKGANPNPVSNPLIFSNPLPKMGKKWKYKNDNAYIRNNYGALKVSHCSIESEIELDFNTSTNRVYIVSDDTKITIPSMVSASPGDGVNNIVGAMILDPQYGSYPTLNGLQFDGIPTFGYPNTLLSAYNFTCSVPGTTPDMASSYQNHLGISYVEADDFRLHFSREVALGFWGYALQMPQYDTQYNNVIADFNYHR